MVEDESKLLWNEEEESWAFPVLPVEENGGKILIEGGRIVTDAERVEIKGKKRSVSESAEDHELHIWTERERRKKMRNMFANLQEFIPNLHPRADKSTIVDEAVAHIKKLQETLEALEKLKGEKTREAFLADQGQGQLQPLPPPPPASSPTTFRTWTSSNVVVNVCGYDAHINIVATPRSNAGIISYVVFIMDKYNLDLVSAHVSSDPSSRIYMIHARVSLPT